MLFFVLAFSAFLFHFLGSLFFVFFSIVVMSCLTCRSENESREKRKERGKKGKNEENGAMRHASMCRYATNYAIRNDRHADGLTNGRTESLVKTY